MFNYSPACWGDEKHSPHETDTRNGGMSCDDWLMKSTERAVRNLADQAELTIRTINDTLRHPTQPSQLEALADQNRKLLDAYKSYVLRMKIEDALADLEAEAKA